MSSPDKQKEDALLEKATALKVTTFPPRVASSHSVRVAQLAPHKPLLGYRLFLSLPSAACNNRRNGRVWLLRSTSLARSRSGQRLTGTMCCGKPSGLPKTSCRYAPTAVSAMRVRGA